VAGSLGGEPFSRWQEVVAKRAEGRPSRRFFGIVGDVVSKARVSVG
jgi:hypothetical protein